jgi:hypothetical protein
LKSDLSAIPEGEIPVKRGDDGEDYYKIEYQIMVAFFSAHMEFSLWYNGKQYGKVSGQFD